MRKDIKNTTEKLYMFFVKIMVGLPGKTTAVQAQWRVGLVKFLQA